MRTPNVQRHELEETLFNHSRGPHNDRLWPLVHAADQTPNHRKPHTLTRQLSPSPEKSEDKQSNPNNPGQETETINPQTQVQIDPQERVTPERIERPQLPVERSIEKHMRPRPQQGGDQEPPGPPVSLKPQEHIDRLKKPPHPRQTPGQPHGRYGSPQERMEEPVQRIGQPEH